METPLRTTPVLTPQTTPTGPESRVLNPVEANPNAEFTERNVFLDKLYNRLKVDEGVTNAFPDLKTFAFEFNKPGVRESIAKRARLYHGIDDTPDNYAKKAFEAEPSVGEMKRRVAEYEKQAPERERIAKIEKEGADNSGIWRFFEYGDHSLFKNMAAMESGFEMASIAVRGGEVRSIGEALRGEKRGEGAQEEAMDAARVRNAIDQQGYNELIAKTGVNTGIDKAKASGKWGEYVAGNVIQAIASSLPVMAATVGTGGLGGLAVGGAVSASMQGAMFDADQVNKYSQELSIDQKKVLDRNLVNGNISVAVGAVNGVIEQAGTLLTLGLAKGIAGKWAAGKVGGTMMGSYMSEFGPEAGMRKFLYAAASKTRLTKAIADFAGTKPGAVLFSALGESATEGAQTINELGGENINRGQDFTQDITFDKLKDSLAGGFIGGTAISGALAIGGDDASAAPAPGVPNAPQMAPAAPGAPQGPPAGPDPAQGMPGTPGAPSGPMPSFDAMMEQAMTNGSPASEQVIAETETRLAEGGELSTAAANATGAARNQLEQSVDPAAWQLLTSDLGTDVEMGDLVGALVEARAKAALIQDEGTRAAAILIVNDLAEQQAAKYDQSQAFVEGNLASGQQPLDAQQAAAGVMPEAQGQVADPMQAQQPAPQDDNDYSDWDARVGEAIGQPMAYNEDFTQGIKDWATEAKTRLARAKADPNADPAATAALEQQLAKAEQSLGSWEQKADRLKTIDAFTQKLTGRAGLNLDPDEVLNAELEFSSLKDVPEMLRPLAQKVGKKYVVKGLTRGLLAMDDLMEDGALRKAVASGQVSSSEVISAFEAAGVPIPASVAKAMGIAPQAAEPTDKSARARKAGIKKLVKAMAKLTANIQKIMPGFQVHYDQVSWDAAMASVSGAARKSIQAWHGSGKVFSKFSLSEVGSGEGAQAFGHGLYFTSLRQIAEKYAKGSQAGVYSVRLHENKLPADYAFIQWHEKLTPEQASRLKDQFEKEGIRVPQTYSAKPGEFDGMSGKEAYQLASGALGSPQAGSAMMLRAGIDGISYPSGTLSTEQQAQGGTNYVVFDEAAVTIDSRSRFMLGNDGSIKGMITSDGQVYLNPETATAATLVHELAGHLMMDFIRRLQPEVWNKWKGLIRTTKTWKRIEADYAQEFAGFSGDALDEAIADEVTATMIEDRFKLDEQRNVLQKVVDAFKSMWDTAYVGYRGMWSMSPEQIARMDINGFLTRMDVDIRRGVVAGTVESGIDLELAREVAAELYAASSPEGQRFAKLSGVEQENEVQRRSPMLVAMARYSLLTTKTDDTSLAELAAIIGKGREMYVKAAIRRARRIAVGIMAAANVAGTKMPAADAIVASSMPDRVLAIASDVFTLSAPERTAIDNAMGRSRGVAGDISALKPVAAPVAEKLTPRSQMGRDGAALSFPEDSTAEYPAMAREAAARVAAGKGTAYDVAWSFYKQREGNNPNVAKMLAAFTAGLDQVQTPWCAAFVSHCVLSAPGGNFKTLLAREFLNYGKAVDIDTAQAGDVVVIARSATGWQGHVGFVVSTTDSSVNILGGNQYDEVNVITVPNDKVLGVRSMQPRARFSKSRDFDPKADPRRAAVLGEIQTLAARGVLVSALDPTMPMTQRELNAHTLLLDSMARTYNTVTGKNTFYSDHISRITEGDPIIFKALGGYLYQIQPTPQRAPHATVSLSLLAMPAFRNMAGRMVARQQITDLLKSNGKAIEKEIVMMVLDSPGFAEAKRIHYDEFKNAVEMSVMRLERISTDSYANYGVDNLGGGGEDTYGRGETIIFNSPVQHGKRGHFYSDFKSSKLLGGGPELRYDLTPMPTQPGTFAAVLHTGQPLTQENLAERVGTVGNEEHVNEWIQKRSSAIPNDINEGLYGHVRLWRPEPDSEDIYMAEMQSDYFQKEDADDLGWTPKTKDEIHHDNLHASKASLAEIGKRLGGKVEYGAVYSPLTSEEIETEAANGRHESYAPTDHIVFSVALKKPDGTTVPLYEINTTIRRPPIDEPLANEALEAGTAVGRITSGPETANLLSPPEIAEKAAIWQNSSQEVKADWTGEQRSEYAGAYRAAMELASDFAAAIDKVAADARSAYRNERGNKGDVISQFRASEKFWEQRILRETIRLAAERGAKRLLFPAPYTVALIEGYVQSSDSYEGEGNNAPYEIVQADDYDTLSAGDIISYGGTRMIVVEADNTDITVAPAGQTTEIDIDAFIDERVAGELEDAAYIFNSLFGTKMGITLEVLDKNQADASSNGDYYTLQAMDLMREKISRMAKDSETGIETIEVDYSDVVDEIEHRIRDDYNNRDMDELFGYTDAYYRDGDTVYAVDDRSSIETFYHPEYYEQDEDGNGGHVDEDDFMDDPSGHLSDEQMTVVKKYMDMAKIVKKLRPDSAPFSDPNGRSWINIPISEADASSPVIAFQEQGGKVRGAISYWDEQRATVHLMQGADISTLCHELGGHLGQKVMQGLAKHSPVYKKHWDAIESWAGVKQGKWTRTAHEKFARGFEKYLRQGKAPVPALRAAFNALRVWLTNIYRTIKGSPLDVNINPQVRRAFDALLAAEDKTGKRVTPKGPRYSKTTPFDATQDPGREAVVQSIKDLATKGVLVSAANSQKPMSAQELDMQTALMDAMAETYAAVTGSNSFYADNIEAIQAANPERFREMGGVLFQQQLGPAEAPHATVSLSLLQIPAFKNMAGRSVARQNITDLLKGNGKQIEKDIINATLNSPAFAEEKKINYTEFKAAIELSLMRLERIKTTSYSNYGMNNLSTYQEAYGKAETIILNSPIDHGKKGHFGGDFVSNNLANPAAQYELTPMLGQPDMFAAVLQDGTPLVQDNLPMRVGTVGTRGEVESWISNRGANGPLNEGLYAHMRLWRNSNPADSHIIYMAEMQSDYFQKESPDSLGWAPTNNKERWEQDIEAFEAQISAFAKSLGGTVTYTPEWRDPNEEDQQIIDYADKLATESGRVPNLKEPRHQLTIAVKFKVGETEVTLVAYNDLAYKLPDLESDEYKHGILSSVISHLNYLRVEEMLELAPEKFVKNYNEYQESQKQGITGSLEWYDRPQEERDRLENARNEIRSWIDDHAVAGHKAYKEGRKAFREKRAQLGSTVEQFKASHKFWEQRTLREGVRLAAERGAKVLRFPHPYTVAIIEGYLKHKRSAVASIDGNAPYEVEHAANPEELAPGDKIQYGGNRWYVLEVSEDGQLLVGPENRVNTVRRSEYIRDIVADEFYETKREIENLFANPEMVTLAQLDAAGGGNNYNADRAIELMGYNIDSQVEDLDADDEDFEDQKAALTAGWTDVEDELMEMIENSYDGVSDEDIFGGYDGYYPDGDGDWMMLLEDESSTQTFGQPNSYNKEEATAAEEGETRDDWFLKNYKQEVSSNVHTVIQKYIDIGKLVTKLYPAAQPTKDEQGFTWLEIPVKPEDASDPVIAFQQEGAKIKGAIEFSDAGKAVVHLMQGADISTLAHEVSGHLGRRVMKKLAAQSDVFKAHYAAVEKWAGVKEGKWTRSAEEKFARGFEKYLRQGKAPIKSLAAVFKALQTWLTNIYSRIRGGPLDVNITPQVRAAFDALLATREKAQGPPPRFSKAMQAEARQVAVERDALGNPKAPNGETSKLPETLHRLVRTPSFKAWFGNWTSDPAASSKVVDENGEPALMVGLSATEYVSFEIHGDTLMPESSKRGVFLNVRQPRPGGDGAMDGSTTHGQVTIKNPSQVLGSVAYQKGPRYSRQSRAARQAQAAQSLVIATQLRQVLQSDPLVARFYEAADTGLTPVQPKGFIVPRALGDFMLLFRYYKDLTVAKFSNAVDVQRRMDAISRFAATATTRYLNLLADGLSQEQGVMLRLYILSSDLVGSMLEGQQVPANILAKIPDLATAQKVKDTLGKIIDADPLLKAKVALRKAWLNDLYTRLVQAGIAKHGKENTEEYFHRKIMDDRAIDDVLDVYGKAKELSPANLSFLKHREGSERMYATALGASDVEVMAYAIQTLLSKDLYNQLFRQYRAATKPLLAAAVASYNAQLAPLKLAVQNADVAVATTMQAIVAAGHSVTFDPSGMPIYSPGIPSNLLIAYQNAASVRNQAMAARVNLEGKKNQVLRKELESMIPATMAVRKMEFNPLLQGDDPIATAATQALYSLGSSTLTMTDANSLAAAAFKKAVADIKRGLSHAAVYREELVVIPRELANHIDTMAQRAVQDPEYVRFMVNISSQLKKHLLFNPASVVPYMTLNAVGDSQMLAASGFATAGAGNKNSGYWSKLSTAAGELRTYYKTGAMTPLLEEAVRGGVVDANQTMAELEGVVEKQIAPLMDEAVAAMLAGKPARSIVSRMLSGMMKVFTGYSAMMDAFAYYNSLREDTMKYAGYLFLREMYDKTGKVGDFEGYSGRQAIADMRASLSGLPVADRAFAQRQMDLAIMQKMVRDSIGGDYGQKTIFSRHASRFIIPFVTFMEVAMRSNWNLYTKSIGADFAKGLVRKGAVALGYSVAMDVAFVLLNLIRFPDEQKELWLAGIYETTLLADRDNVGHAQTMRVPTALSFVLEFIGVYDVALMATLWPPSNSRDVAGLARDWWQGRVNKLVQAVGPLVKTPFEMILDRSFYPSIYSPKVEEDDIKQLVAGVGAGKMWEYAYGLPKREQSAAGMILGFIFLKDRDLAALMSARAAGIKREILGLRQSTSGPDKSSQNSKLKRELLTRASIALRVGQTEEAIAAYTRFKAMGGNLGDMIDASARTSPFSGLSDAMNQKNFAMMATIGINEYKVHDVSDIREPANMDKVEAEYRQRIKSRYSGEAEKRNLAQLERDIDFAKRLSPSDVEVFRRAFAYNLLLSPDTKAMRDLDKRVGKVKLE